MYTYICPFIHTFLSVCVFRHIIYIKCSLSHDPGTVSSPWRSVHLPLVAGGIVSGHGHHQRLLLPSLAQNVGQHERGEEAELHGVAELEQLQVGGERPLKHGAQVLVVIAVLGKENHV